MKRAGFTLTEIILAIAIIATAMVAVLGLLPAGLNASRDAADSTVVASILEDLNDRLKGQPIRSGPADISPAYFDVSGHHIDLDPANPTPLTNAIYRADIEVMEWYHPPDNTSGLRPVKIALSWPIKPENGAPVGTGNPKAVVTFGVTNLTGPEWEKIDRSYIPKIEY